MNPKKGKAKAPLQGDEPWLVELLHLALFPALLTAGAAVVALAVALLHGGPEIFRLAGGFVLGLAAIFFSVTFLIGGLALVPSALRRLIRRVARARRWDAPPDPALWDNWLDGP
jgi:hypothetical protein